ncbi:hypothetical protein AC529_01115 [Thermobifida cellulosilytica TB100]|uniref:Uncharacterized protein n=1 Tax=Thermobifida cellulosilytica TB100 TaxID=665004 RepID=A0A147KMF5_THECS|nr:hypothetical protein AC529_01115 [Thermobifida cellulosilytica TB100]
MVSPVKSQFTDRVCAGIGEALHRARQGGTAGDDTAAVQAAVELLDAYQTITELMRTASEEQRPPEDTAEGRIARITAVLAGDRRLLMAALYSPLAVVAAVNKHHEGALDRRQQWGAWCWTVEAAWRCVARRDGLEPTGFTSAELDILAPVAARQRFLAFAEAYRTCDATPADCPADAASRVFGPRTSHLFVARSIEARWIWKDVLDHAESHPALGQATAGELEQEVNLLLFDRGRPGAVLGMSTTRLDLLSQGKRSRMLSNGDRGTVREVVERHLLPRFQIVDTLRLALTTAQHPGCSRITASAVVLAGAAALVLVTAGLCRKEICGLSVFTLAASAAGACYLIGAVGSVVHGREWALPWLLRMPAASAIGLFMLTAMHPSWWRAAFPEHWLETVAPGSAPPGAAPSPVWAAFLLASAAYVYLLVTARNHGLERKSALWRAALVWLVGGCHALLISLLGLVWIVPVFSEEGALLYQGWTTYSGPAVITLAQATAWCLTAGVFSQILWDDQPITAPLAHIRWHKDR